MEEINWNFIQRRYVNKGFKKEMSKNLKIKLEEYYNKEEKREIKNNMIASLLIKFICRTLPYIPIKDNDKDLFEMLMNKNINLNEKIKNELEQLKKIFGAKLCEIVDITRFFVQKNNLRNKMEKKEEKKEIQKVEEQKDNKPQPNNEEKEESDSESDDDNKRVGF